MLHIGLMKTLRQSTTGFTLLEALQKGAFPECPPASCSERNQIGHNLPKKQQRSTHMDAQSSSTAGDRFLSFPDSSSRPNPLVSVTLCSNPNCTKFAKHSHLRTYIMNEIITCDSVEPSAENEIGVQISVFSKTPHF
ncbi:hypothetical protein CSKR_108164 [Clonorchis sinensis]|uniref:Uncharacterized protein n=1 Tax=Clonorchis sinensis TaxID=79923 RepID=A0A3R7DEH0_CLOSI|nr:hypothetical protein CSKR_108164 [Clonorchis sinensis]